MGGSDTCGCGAAKWQPLFPGQDGAVLTWDGVHAFLLQLWEVLQEELEGVICSDALELEPVHVGLRGQMGLMPARRSHSSSAAQPSVCSTSWGNPFQPLFPTGAAQPPASPGIPLNIPSTCC